MVKKENDQGNRRFTLTKACILARWPGSTLKSWASLSIRIGSTGTRGEAGCVPVLNEGKPESDMSMKLRCSETEDGEGDIEWGVPCRELEGGSLYPDELL